MKKYNLLYRATTVLSLMGILLASYLFFSYLSPKPPQLCRISATVNCDAVTKGEISTIFGIPVSLIGLTGYIVIFLSSIFQKKKVLLGMTTFGMLFCLRLLIIEIFILKVICPVCVMCQIIMALVFILSLYLNLSSKKTSK